MILTDSETKVGLLNNNEGGEALKQLTVRLPAPSARQPIPRSRRPSAASPPAKLTRPQS